MALLVFRQVYDFGVSANAGNIAPLLIISALVAALGSVLEELKKLENSNKKYLLGWREMIKKDDPRIKEWRDGVPFDENGEVIRGVQTATQEELEGYAQILNDYVEADPDNDPKVRPWLNYLSI